MKNQIDRICVQKTSFVTFFIFYLAQIIYLFFEYLAGGAIKFLRLKQRNVAGLVTDGSVRDSASLIDYGFPVFSHGKTANQGPAAMWPWGLNEEINCGGVLVSVF